MRLKKVTQLGSAIVLSVAAMLAVGAPNAFAASKSWIGTDCTGGTPNCNWSDVNNWTGGVVPVNGDDITFDNAIMDAQASAPVDDIAGLNLNSIIFTNDAASGSVTIQLAQPLIVSSAITQQATVTSTDDALGNTVGTGQLITLGGNVTVTTNYRISFGSDLANDQIALATHNLTFVDGAGTNAKLVPIHSVISGSGTVTMNAPLSDFQISQAGTYSGATVLTAGQYYTTANNINPFGTSSVHITTASNVNLGFTTAQSLTNAITIDGTVNGSQVTSLAFDCGTGCGGPITVTVPNITLNGNTRFAADMNQTINLTGIVANGHCIEYLVSGTATEAEAAAHFTGGPAYCIVAATVAKAPKTGLASTVAQPAAVLAATVAAAFALFVVARRLKTVKN